MGSNSALSAGVSCYPPTKLACILKAWGLLLVCALLALTPTTYNHKEELPAGWLLAKPHHATSIRLPQPKLLVALEAHIAATYQISDKLAASVVHNAWQVAEETHVPLLLILAVTAVESSFQPTAHSPTGAKGLMQVKATAHPELVVSAADLTGVRPNLSAGTQILATYLQQTGGDLTKALQRYNGARKDRHARYAHKVLARMHEFSLAVGSLAPGVPAT